MLLLFSPNISVRKKIFYYGLIFTVISGILFMNTLHTASSTSLAQWAVSGGVSGLSIALLAIMYPIIKRDYKKINNFYIKFIFLVLPLIIIVFIYLICIFADVTEQANQYLILNIRVVPMSWIFILIVEPIFRSKE